jgi:hypothetical protein
VRRLCARARYRTEQNLSSSSERTEQNGTEPRAPRSAAVERPPAENSSNSQNADDDDKTTAEQKLFTLFEQTGEVLTADTLRRIREHLELREIDLQAYVEALAPKLKPNGHIVSPTAIALDLAKKFGSKTHPARIPKAEKPRCQTCHTLDTGRGLVLSDDGKKFVPCATCATAEYKLEHAAKEAERAAKLAKEAAAV